jgi:type III secretion system YscQ/HrcQ family protein
VAEYPPYQFPGLEKYSSNEVTILNRANVCFFDSEQIGKILASVADALLLYDIYNAEGIDIQLTVKPVGEIAKAQRYRLPNPNILLGRVNDNNVVLKSPLVSKKHAEIFRRGVEYYIKDLNSNNGTSLNEVKLVPGSDVSLRNEDVVRIDPFEITIGLPQEIVRRPLSISPHSVHVTRENKMKGHICIFFQLEPSNQTGALLLEQQVARWMVQKIITGQRDHSISPWTEIETGFLEYLAARLLSTINPLLQNCRLMLQSVELEESAFQAWLSKQQPSVELTLSTDTEIGLAYAFLYLPDPIITDSGNTGAVSNFLSQALWTKNLQYSFIVNLGASFLSADQISLLETDDIILLDRAQINLEEGRPKGKAEIRSDRLRRGAISVTLDHEEDGKAKLTIEALFEEGLKAMSDAKKKTEGPQANANEGVLSSIEIPVVVEFARLNFTLDELSVMKQGQIIEISKAQPDIVDLSVDGKIIANGKLVDVEGKLGVRILKMLQSN